MKGFILCPYCMATEGLQGSEVEKKSFQTDEQFAKHIEDVHNIPVRMPGETHDQCQKRFKLEHPEASDPKTCRCPSCKAKRGDIRELLVSVIKKNNLATTVHTPMKLTPKKWAERFFFSNTHAGFYDKEALYENNVEMASTIAPVVIAASCILDCVTNKKA